MAENMADNLPLSAAHIFREIEHLVSKTDCYPLSQENLVVQQDAYGRLGGIGDENVYAGEPFATLEQGNKSSDKDLRFMAVFTDLGIALDIEGWGEFQQAYDELGSSPK